MSELSKEDELILAKRQWNLLYSLRVNADRIHVNPKTGRVEGINGQHEGTNIIANSIASQMKKAYWEMLTQELSKNPPNYEVIIDRVKEFKATIKPYLNEKKWQTFDSNINIDELREQIEDETFTYQSFKVICQAMFQGLYECESVFEHENTQKFFNTTFETNSKNRIDFHERITHSLQFFFNQLDILKAQILEYNLKRQSQIEYAHNESLFFAKMLEEGKVRLEKTHDLLKEEFTNHLENINDEKKNEMNSSLYYELLMKLAKHISEDPVPFAASKYPEPLELSTYFMINIQNELQSISVICVLLMQLNEFEQSANEKLWKDVVKLIRSRLKVEDFDFDKTLFNCKNILEENKNINSPLKNDTDSKNTIEVRLKQQQMIHSRLKIALDIDKPFIQLIMSRVRYQFLESVKNLCLNKLYVSPSNSLGVSPTQLKYAVDIIDEIALKYLMYLNDHWKIYAFAYRTVADDLNKPKDSEILPAKTPKFPKATLSETDFT